MITETRRTTRPRRCTPQELAKVGVRVLDEISIHLGCKQCGREWSPLLRRVGRMPKGYWQCPEGCNPQS